MQPHHSPQKSMWAGNLDNKKPPRSESKRFFCFNYFFAISLDFAQHGAEANHGRAPCSS